MSSVNTILGLICARMRPAYPEDGPEDCKFLPVAVALPVAPASPSHAFQIESGAERPFVGLLLWLPARFCVQVLVPSASFPAFPQPVSFLQRFLFSLAFVLQFFSTRFLSSARFFQPILFLRQLLALQCFQSLFFLQQLFFRFLAAVFPFQARYQPQRLWGFRLRGQGHGGGAG